MSRIRPVDKAFEVRMPNDGERNLYAITVLVKSYTPETAIQDFGEAKLYGKYFSIDRVDEVTDEDGNIEYVPHSPESETPN